MIGQTLKTFNFEGGCYGDQIRIFTSCYVDKCRFSYYHSKCI